MENLKQISCDPKCGFMVRSHKEDEVINMAKLHVKTAHPEMKYSDKEIKSMVKTVKE